MKRKKIAYSLIFILLLTSLSSISANAATSQKIKRTETESSSILENDFSHNIEPLLFGPSQVASNLAIEGIIEDKVLSYSKDEVKTKEFHFDPSQCIIHQINQKQVYLEIEELKPFGSPGDPMLPMKTFVIEIPKNSEVLGVGITDGYCKEIMNRLNIVPNPEPVFWTNDRLEAEKIIDSLLPNMKVYNSDRFFPGIFASYDVGEDNEKKLVFVRVYPVQYIPKLKKTILLTDGLVKVFYKHEGTSVPSSLSKDPGVVNVIITPPPLFDQAVELKTFHDTEGTSTAVVNTTWIYAQYGEAGDPPYDGYSDPTLPGWETIHNYNYSLAKRIINYLSDSDEHPNLQYVTLLGNALIVPPSYYYYDSWTPTDFFYASPDYDLVPNYFVGRLPINDAVEAAHVIDKIKHWNATSDLFRNITVAGGKPFGTPYDIGEMIATDSINRGFFGGVNPTKYFKTEESFDRINLTHALMGDTGLLYHIGHGSGTAWSLEGDPLDIDDVMNLPASDTSPIVVSIACMNGAFDTNLMDMGFNVSFGESILLSDAGGVAYIGGSRSNAGVPYFNLDEGYVTISKEPYMAGMLTYLIEAYHEGGSTLGNLTAHAMMTYIEHNNLSDPTDSFTFFAFVLLGDPALQLPPRPSESEYQTPHSSIEDPIAHIDVQFLQQLFMTMGSGEIPLGVVGENMTMISTTNSPTVDIKLIDALKFDEMVLEKSSMPTVGNSVSYEFLPTYGTLYSIRTITEDGREGWLYATAARIVDDDYDETTPGWQVTRWAVIQDAVDSSSGGKTSDLIFVFNGTYQENILLDKSIKLFGENNIITIIDGGGVGSVVDVIEQSCSISGFTITNGGEQEGDAGIVIRADMTVASNNIIAHNNMGILVSGGSTPIIQYNSISNNTYGLYLENKYFGYIIGNIIQKNQFGLYLSESENQYPIGNTINANTYGAYLEKSDMNAIVLNNITNNEQGVYLKKSNNNAIMSNNFINNKRHAQFYKCYISTWQQNYWDNWIGLKLNLNISLPKLIFGRIGIVGLIPWINMDREPANILWNIDLPFG
ncbi:MAG: right-handed parallel beta-helix repeat-containing protein [Thermoplasmatales archaeon]|nr:right-handed parallel beta-helix repeat-containing protein [Thermoplasmatales archaeon]